MGSFDNSESLQSFLHRQEIIPANPSDTARTMASLSPAPPTSTIYRGLQCTENTFAHFSPAALSQRFMFNHGEAQVIPAAPCASPTFPIGHHQFYFETQLHELSPCVRYIPRALHLKLLQDDVNNSFNSDSFIIEMMETCIEKLVATHIEKMRYINETRMDEIFGDGPRHFICSSSSCPDAYKFFSKRPPNINMAYYIKRLLVYCNCSASSFIVMLVYLDRIERQCPALVVNDLNIHRLVLTGLVLAIKYLDDDVYPNSHYAYLGGVSTQELNGLELVFLDAIGWDVNVRRELFDVFRNELTISCCYPA